MYCRLLRFSKVGFALLTMCGLVAVSGYADAAAEDFSVLQSLTDAYRSAGTSGLPLVKAKQQLLSLKKANLNHLSSEQAANLIGDLNYFESLVLEALLAGGFDPNKQNAQGETLLQQLYTQRRHPLFFELALAYGANPNIKDLSGRTALERLPNIDAPSLNRIRELLNTNTVATSAAVKSRRADFWSELKLEVDQTVKNLKRNQKLATKNQYKPIGLADQSKIQVGPKALVMTHVSYGFKGAERVNRAVDRLMAEHKKTHAPTYFLIEDSNIPGTWDLSWATKDSESTANLLSSAGEHGSSLAANDITLVGGWLGACFNNTLDGFLSQVGQGPIKQLKIRIPIQAVFSGHGISLGDEFKNEFYFDSKKLADYFVEKTANQIQKDHLEIRILVDGIEHLVYTNEGKLGTVDIDLRTQF